MLGFLFGYTVVSEISLVRTDSVVLLSALIPLVLQNNTNGQLAPQVMIKTEASQMQYGLFSLSVSILLPDYNPFIENKTCLTQALSNHHSFYVRRRSLF